MIWKQFTHLGNFPPELKARFNSFLTTEFDDSLSVEMQLRSIIKWCQGNFKTVDTLIDFINDLSNWLKQFETTFDTKLEDSVISVISEWQASGQIDVIISEALQTEIDDVKATREDVFNAVGFLQNDNLLNELQSLLDLAHSLGYRKFILPKGVYDVTGKTYHIPSDLSLIGSNTTLLSNGGRTEPIFYIKGNNIEITGITFDLTQSDRSDEQSLAQGETAIMLDGNTKNTLIKKNTFRRGYSGVWVHPTERGQHYDIVIEDNLFELLNHPIYLGLNTTDTTMRTDKIDNVVIHNNIIRDGYNNSDGVKTIQNVKNVRITENTIERMKRDGLDLYTSGENVVVTNNIIRDNVHQGLDIKDGLTPAYSSETYGFNRFMVISNNIIENNHYGIGVASGGVYGITISDNIVRGNQVRGISLHGRHITVSGNQVYNNCLFGGDASGAIHVYYEPPTPSQDIAIIGNNVFNNGAANNETYGIKLASSCNRVTISANTVTNDTERPNANQKCGVFIIGTAKNVKFNDNTVNGHSRDIWIKNQAGVIGKKISTAIEGNSNPTGSYNIDNLLLIGDGKKHIVDIRILNRDAVAASTAVYLNYRLRKAKDGVLDTTSIATINTQSGVPSYTPLLINTFNDGSITSDPRKLNDNEILVLNLQSVGSIPTIEVIAEINYIES